MVQTTKRILVTLHLHTKITSALIRFIFIGMRHRSMIKGKLSKMLGSCTCMPRAMGVWYLWGRCRDCLGYDWTGIVKLSYNSDTFWVRASKSRLLTDWLELNQLADSSCRHCRRWHIPGKLDASEWLDLNLSKLRAWYFYMYPSKIYLPPRLHFLRQH